MKIDDNKLVMRNKSFDLNEIALIGIQQNSLYEEFGLEDNYWLEFKFNNGDKYDLDSSRTNYESDIVRRFKIIHKLLIDEGLNHFTSLGYMIVNIDNVKDIRFINKNKGIEIVFKDFHIDYPQLGKWRAKKAMKQYKQKVKEMEEEQVLQQ
ncbi:MAG: hypothetical protein IJ458_03725 [Clostridia bacterium]|nr:hypothetical protein [Clostridia bacterium]